MKKDLFTAAIKSYQRYCDYEDEARKFGLELGDREEIQDVMLSLFEILCYDCKEDTSNYHMPNVLEKFIFLSDFGRRNPCIIDDFHIANADELWDYLVSVHPEINDN